MKINFHKSEVIVTGVDEEEQTRVARLLNCNQGKFPFTYLGFTMSDHKLTIADNEPIHVICGAPDTDRCLLDQPSSAHNGTVPIGRWHTCWF
jgi:hypothetical protein